MKRTTTMNNLMESLVALQEVSKKPIKLGTSIKIAKTLNAARELAVPYQERIQKRHKELCEEVEVDGKKVPQLTGENKELFQKEYDEAVAEEVTIEYEAIKLAELGDISIEPAILSPIIWIIEDV